VRLWRISDFGDLSGQGGLIGAARWHSRGRRIVYLADHPAAALIEVLVHLEVDVLELPDAYQLLAIDAADDIMIDTVHAANLPADWQEDPLVTRDLGDAWLREGRTALLQVPSAIVPAAFNWLLNPAHAGAGRVTVAEVIRTRFDQRLLD
jgi:RES domain-containing protein